MRSRTLATLGFAVFLLGFLGFAASCSLVRAIFPASGPPPRPFNHQAHLERGLDCATCHEGGEKETRAGMPSVELCMTCHEDLDKDPAKPMAQKVAVFLGPDGKPQWSSLTRQSSEIRFSHSVHAARKVACAACHEGIEKDTGLAGPLVQRMDSCVACHAKEASAKNDCSTCHAEIRRDRPPASHARMWDQAHGLCALQGAGASTANDCSLCHERDACANCHQTRPPRDHHAFFRLKGHGIAAGIDRTRCATCHASDSCDRCHQSTAPVTHTAGWDAPRNRHCTSCHVPLQSSGSCFVCHKSAPGHDTAPVKPAWHTAAMNCRSCHSASLKHPDNGDNCNSCHR